MPVSTRCVVRSSRDRVERVFRSLRETYRSFDVHQTSVALTPTAYETVLRDGLVDAAVRVENADGAVLAVEDDGWREPRVRFDHEEGVGPAECAQSAIADLTGVACRITGPSEVSMVTIHDQTDADRPPKFVLDVRFLARYEGGTPRDGAAWRDEVEREPGVRSAGVTR